MTGPRFDDQRLVHDELEARLTACREANAVPAEAWLDLAGLTGQGRRLASHLVWPELDQACRRAEAFLAAGADALAAAAAEADLRAPLDALIFAVDDPDPDAYPVLDALYQLDLAILAVAQAGDAARATALAEAAADVLAAFPDAAALVSGAAQRFCARHGETGPPVVMWREAAQAASAIQAEATLAPVDEPPWLAGLLEAAQGRADNVVVLAFPQAAVAGEAQWRAAAADEWTFTEAFEVARGPDTGQVVVMARPGGARVALFEAPQGVCLQVEIDGAPVRVEADDDVQFADVPLGVDVRVEADGLIRRVRLVTSAESS